MNTQKITQTSVFALLLIVTFSSAVGADQKYPPYPNVWDWVAPQGMENIGLRLETLDDGDVQIVYEDRSKMRDSYRPVFSTKFFDRRQTQRQLLPTSNSIVAGQQSYKAELKNGSVVHGSMGPGLRSNRCYDRLSGGVTIDNQQGRATTVKKLFYLFDKPRIWRVSAACKGMDGPDVFSYRVESIFAEILPLRDDTFLVIDSSHGLVIRFDTKFQTKSILIGRRIFVVGPDFVEKIRGSTQQYADFTDYAELHKALYRNLITTTQEK